MKILLNKDLDNEVYLSFYDAVVGGANFGKKIHDDHPNITVENHSDYIDKFYKNNRKVLEETIDDTVACFDEIKDALFNELKKYFGKDYTNENYTCYLSIFNCNPRYLEEKHFQVYYKRSRNMRKEVIAHELTHFAFYDFCSNLGIKDDKKLWELSEIFNVLFLNIPSIQNAIGAEELLFYPDLKEKLDKVRNVWLKKSKAKDFIEESLNLI